MQAWLANIVYLILQKILVIPLVKYFNEVIKRKLDEKKTEEVKKEVDNAQTEQERIDAARRNASSTGST
jgi:hypothetical protein